MNMGFAWGIAEISTGARTFQHTPCLSFTPSASLSLMQIPEKFVEKFLIIIINYFDLWLAAAAATCSFSLLLIYLIKMRFFLLVVLIKMYATQTGKCNEFTFSPGPALNVIDFH